MFCRSRFNACVLIVGLAACGGSPRVAAPRERDKTPQTPTTKSQSAPDSDRDAPAPKQLLAIDWKSVKIASDADALALWDRIAPTGDDWTLKLDEVPPEIGYDLALALLRAGNFTCMTPPPARDCVPKVFDVDPPKPTATHRDPCLRRLLALWALDQIDNQKIATLVPVLQPIVAIPPPESELTTAALEAAHLADPSKLVELYAIAYRAGHRDLVDSMLGRLEEPYLVEAVSKHHIGGALDGLSAQSHRALYLAAIGDEQLATKVRQEAIIELVADTDKLAPDVRGALAKAAASKDCGVAAAAARAFERRGDKRYVPKRPRTLAVPTMMRALCVLASYEPLQQNDEASLLPTFLPPKGLERVDIAYDPILDDSQPPNAPTVDLVPRAQAVMPEALDMAKAMKNCKATVCTSDDRIFHFVLKPVGGALTLARLEIAERPRCHVTQPAAP